MLTTRYNYKPSPGEPGGGEKLVETSGYIPADVRIQELIMAGERLGDYRRESYDYGPDDEIDDLIEDPTRHPSFGLEDGSQYDREVAQRLEKQKADAKARKKLEAAPPVPEAPPASEPPPDGN